MPSCTTSTDLSLHDTSSFLLLPGQVRCNLQQVMEGLPLQKGLRGCDQMCALEKYGYSVQETLLSF